MNVETSPAVQFLSETLPLDPDIRKELDKGTKTSVYGPFLEAMIRFGAERIKDGSNNPDATEIALGIAASLYWYANEEYTQQDHPLSGEELVRHQTNVLNGRIELVPAETATSVKASINQVNTANDFISHQPTNIQAILAAINYGVFFRPQTMASATRTLDRREIEDLLATKTQEAMPHLTVSNWAIGQTTAGLYRAVAMLPQPGRLRIFDIGSGHGATLAATTNSMCNVSDIDRKPEIAITAIETTPEFYEELVRFAKGDEGATKLDLKRASHSAGANATISEFGTLTTVRSDAMSVLQNIDLMSGVRDNDITVVTANYSWHRFGGVQKAELMRLFYKLPNIIFIIGDLAQNTSTINRRYFNLAANGPLNAGNRGLSHRFGKFGYSIVDLDKFRPTALDPRIARRLSHDHKYEDGHLWIAHLGKNAYEALNLVNAD